jgi:hypothetical protein
LPIRALFSEIGLHLKTEAISMGHSRHFMTGAPGIEYLTKIVYMICLRISGAAQKVIIFMKFFNSVTYPMFGLIAFSLLSSTMASAGVGAGGGGDAVTEMRIDDIRADLVKWIEEGGARELKLPARTNYAEYMSGMEKVLPRHGVIIGAVTAAEELATNDEELKVIVEGQPKTCRGFVSKKDFLPHILCNTERFSSTPAPDPS